ncbi:NAD(P)-dependent alcohol dehydrogenase [Eisenbergiella sp.]
MLSLRWSCHGSALQWLFICQIIHEVHGCNERPHNGEGKYDAHAHHNVLGSDVAGIVEAVGKDVKSIKVDDEVFGITPNMLGAWVEYACAAEKDIFAKSANLTFEQAAALPTGCITALGAVRKSNVKAGQQVLVYGASGNVGQFAVQLSKTAGAIVTGVCSTRNIKMVKSIGADYAVDYKKKDFAVMDKKYDVIIAVNGYRTLSTYKNALDDNGTYIVIGGVKQAMLHGMGGPIRSIDSSKKMSFVIFAQIKDRGLDYIKEQALEDADFRNRLFKEYMIAEK